MKKIKQPITNNIKLKNVTVRARLLINVARTHMAINPVA
jgi:hypothetical protein